MRSRPPYLSIIIPVLDEAALLPGLLEHLPTGPEVEILFIDGGSRDHSRRLLLDAGQILLESERGRARQMNQGSRYAQGEILLFLHADSVLEEGAVASLIQCMKDPSRVGGAFRLRIQGTAHALHLIEWGVSIRSRLLRIPYGDQGLFIRSKTFHDLGGYRDLPIMEDLDLVRRMKKKGRLVVLSKSIRTSDRRWRKNGIFKTTSLNALLATLFFLRVPVKKLANLHGRFSDPAHGKAPSDMDPGCQDANADRGPGESTTTSHSHQVSAHERIS